MTTEEKIHTIIDKCSRRVSERDCVTALMEAQRVIEMITKPGVLKGGMLDNAEIFQTVYMLCREDYGATIVDGVVIAPEVMLIIKTSGAFYRE